MSDTKTTTFKTMGGDVYEIVGEKWPGLVNALRSSMLSPSVTNAEYMKRLSRLGAELFGVRISTETERDFVVDLINLGIVRRLD